MKRPWTTWLARSLWAVWVVLFVTFLLIGADPSRALVAVAATFAMVTVGALVASRRPANPIGWIFCALGLGFFVGGLSSEYATRALVDAPGSLPGGLAIGWLSSWAQFPATMLVLYLLLLFPNGHPPSPRWRGVVWLVTAVIAVGTLTAALLPGPLRAGPTGSPLPVDNPLAFHAVAPLLEVVSAVVPAASVALLVIAIASVIVRFRRAQGEERQQMKWFLFASGFVPAVIASNVVLRLLPEGLRAPLQTATFSTAMALFPIVVGVAILRYRLYDIDVIIRRTLIYAAVSLTLAATYFAGVVLLQTALRPLIGGSEVPVALSTLAVVALFAPLRRRIQQVVDRRFYRSRYDAAHTLDAFGARLRDEVDLEAVRGDLLEAVHQTVRPVHASVWLRER
jgi:hypothetical protein